MTVLSLTPALRTHYGAPTDRGVLVAEVAPRSPAASAGIAVGDVITSVHGRPVASADDLRAALAARSAGDRAPIQLVRDGQARSLDATLTADAATAAWSALGIEAAMKWLIARHTWVAPPVSAAPSWMHALRTRFEPSGDARRD